MTSDTMGKITLSGESRSAPEAEFSDAERAAVKKFFAALRARCESVREEDNCLCCDMRLFCYAAPPSKTDDMLDDVMNFLQDRKLAAEIVAQMNKFYFRDIPASSRLSDPISFLRRLLHTLFALIRRRGQLSRTQRPICGHADGR